MAAEFMIYGANGFLGQEMAMVAVEQGLQPILAGRSGPAVKALADKYKLPSRIFDLADAQAVDEALQDIRAVLHCAGPYKYTYQAMVEGCLRTGTHYLDISGEIPVYEALAGYDEKAKEKAVMILPGVGFDVVPTDCLAVHLKQRLPSATSLTLAFKNEGGASLPPGTANTLLEMVPYGVRARVDGRLQRLPAPRKRKMIDFGTGPVEATMLTWGDLFMAFKSTAIPNIEEYVVFPGNTMRQMETLDKISSLLRVSLVRNMIRRGIKTGSTAEARSLVNVVVWGEVKDDEGRAAVSRLHGPEAGVEWTVPPALGAVKKILDGEVTPGFQTPGLAFGPDFVLETPGVIREDVM